MTVKKMTASQKRKADKVISLLEDLSKEGITFYMNSTPDLQIAFCRTTDNIEFDDWVEFINSKEGQKVYYPDNKIRKESYGY